MVADYGKLTITELVEALEAADKALVRLNAKVEVQRQHSACLQERVETLSTELTQARHALRDGEELRQISMRVSGSLANAWLEIVDYLHR